MNKMRNTWILGLLLAADAGWAGVTYDPEIPQVEFAAREVKQALSDADADVIFSIQPNPEKPESFTIEKNADGLVQVIGTDAAGAMYGGLELAELLRIGGVDRIMPITKNPYMGMRGIKFNIPLDVRTPSYSDFGDAGQQAMEDVWDFEFWTALINEMARYRYNYISLWNLHPFPSLMKVPEYPNVALDDVKRSTTVWGKSHDLRGQKFDAPEILKNTETLKKMSIEEKIDFWRKVMRYGKERNVDFYFVTWNIFDYGTAQQYGIDDKRDNPVSVDYFRKSVKQLFLTYPDLKGIGLTTGENMPRASQQKKEAWAFNTYGLGVLDVVKEQPGRKITFLHRQHQTGALKIADQFQPLIDHPDIEFLFSFKYAKAHVYSATTQPYHEGFVKDIQARGDLKTIWTLRNDSVYLYRWAAPGFVREFVQNIPYDVSQGYYYGSDGWIWGRDFTSLNEQDKSELQISKHWFQWMLWGRLAYDPKIGDTRFAEIVQSRFPQVDAANLMAAWEAASMVYPLVTGFHWGVLDFKWYPEGCISRPQPAQNATGFHDVNRFITLEAHPKSGYVSIPEYADIVLAEKPFTGPGPFEVATQMNENAERALALIKTMDAGGNRELAETLGDIETMAYLGQYYAHKIKGSTSLHLYRESGQKGYQKDAVAELEAAARCWRSYTASSSKRCVNPIWYNRVPIVDWTQITQWVDEDIQIAKNDPGKKED